MTEEPQRPDPDALLAQADTLRRGKLKIYFGACAGVGKTWSMLQEARRLRSQGLDVLVGVVQELVPEASGKSTIAVLKPGAVPAERIFERLREKNLFQFLLLCSIPEFIHTWCFRIRKDIFFGY